jgi:phosphate:Na+ symporter
VQVLSFDISRVAPVFILIGVMMFRRGGNTRTHDFGRVGIGLGLILMALAHLLAILTPYEDVPSLRLLLGAIATVPIVDVIVAAALTWAAHSSVAVVLLTMSFAAQGVVPPEAAFALVLGANLGAALNPLFEAGSTGDPAAKRLPIGNLLNRLVGCILGLALLHAVGSRLVAFEPSAYRAVADFHTFFNIVMAVLFFPVLGPLARLLRWMLPARAVPETRRGRFISTRPLSRFPRSPLPPRRARPCAWPMFSKPCCMPHSKGLIALTESVSPISSDSTMCSTGSTAQSKLT